MAKITYANKVALNEQSDIANENKTTYSDMNEIKEVVNENDTNVGDLSSLTTAIKDSIVGAINELNSPVNNILWEGGYYMSATQVANLSKKVSEQKHGIVLVWTNYENGQIQNNGVNCFFIPKKFVELYPSMGHGQLLIHGWNGNIGKKYVYISDDKITGFANNSEVVTENNIAFYNNQYVLRYVIGV